jgi:putative membrane protein
MKLHALALVAAFAMPAIASADEPKPVNPPANSDTRPTDPGKADPTKPADPGKADPTKADDTGKTDTTKTTDTGKTDPGKPGKLADADVKIISHLHHVNLMEIELGKLAQKSGTPRIKDYASTLVTDHQSSDKDLTAFAKTHKLAAIPADKPMTDADRQDDKDMTTSMARIKTLKGAEFDKEYLNMMVSGHDKELTKIDTAVSSAGDPDLQAMLKSVKPVLQRHADQARDLMKSPQAAIDPNKPIDKLPSQR